MGWRTWRFRLIFLMLISTLSYGIVFGFVPVVAASPPGAPQNLTSTSSTTWISLFWSAPASDGGSTIIGYYVYRGTASGGEGFYGFASNTGFADKVPLVTPSTTYYYRVDAVNGIGEGAFSSEIVRSLISPPSAPQNPSAKAGGGVVTLTATPPTSNGGAPIYSYGVYKSTTSGSEVLTFGCAPLACYDTSVTSGTTYYYKLAAFNTAGASSLSSEVSATPSAPAAPSAPQSLGATPGGGVVILTWTPPASNGNAPLYYYQILRATTSGTETYYTSIFGNVTTYIDTSASAGTTFYYEVKAVNFVSQVSVVSNEVSATPTTPTAPSPPLSLAAIFTAGGVNLTWSAPTTSGNSPLSYYKVYRGTTSGGESCCIAFPYTASFRDGYPYYPISPATTYYYKVSAFNTAGLESSLSGEVSVTTPATNPPSGPQGLVASAGAALGVGGVTLTYAAPTSSGGWPLSYAIILRGTTSGAEVSICCAANLTYFIDSTASAGITYYYKVQYQNTQGTAGSFSSEVSVTVPSAPSAPQTLVVTGSSGRISLSWSAPASNGASPILGYYIYRGTSSTNESFYSSVAGTSYADSSISLGTTYYYKVAAFNAGGFQSSPSSEANAKPASPTPLTPASLLLPALATATLPLLRRNTKRRHRRD